MLLLLSSLAIAVPLLKDSSIGDRDRLDCSNDTHLETPDKMLKLVSVAGLLATAAASPCPAPGPKPLKRVDLGPRPGFLVDDMDEGYLKEELSECLNSDTPWKASTFSIAHRGGGTLMIPEHSLESNMAGARMGAGILECDTAFTKDRQLVCRKSQSCNKERLKY